MKKNKKFLFRFLFFVFLLGLWLLYAFYKFPRQSWVDGLLESWFLSKGLVMYRDFTNQYFPLLFMLLVPFHKIFGFSQMPTVYLAPVTSIFTLCVLAYFSYKYIKGWVKVIPPLFFAFWDPILLENHFTTAAFHSIVNLLIFVSWYVWYDKPTRFKVVVLGFLLSISLLSMQIVILYVLVVICAVLYRTLTDKKNLGINHFLLFLTGFFIPCLFILLWLKLTGAWSGFWYWNVSYYFSGTYPFLSMGKSSRDFRMFIGIFSPLIISLFICIENLFKYFQGRFNNIKSRIQIKDFWVFLISLILPATFLFAVFHPSRFYMAMSQTAFVFGISLSSIKERSNTKRYYLLTLLGLIIFLNTFTFIKDLIPIYERYFNYPRKYQMLDKIVENDPIYPAINWIKGNTPENSKLFVTESSLFYFASQRFPSSSRATMSLPMLFRPLSSFREEIIAKPPDYWVIDERNWTRFINFGYKDVSDYIKKIVSCGKVVARFDYITIVKHAADNVSCFDSI